MIFGKKLVRVRFLISAANPKYTVSAGDVRDLDAADAREEIAAGRAAPSDEPVADAPVPPLPYVCWNCTGAYAYRGATCPYCAVPQ